MKRYCSDFKFTLEVIEKSLLECLYHKTGKCVRWYRKDTAYFLAEYWISGGFTTETNIHKVAYQIWKQVKINKTEYEEKLIPYIAKCILAEIEGRNIVLKPIEYQERIDSSSLKVRKIGITSIKQQVYDYIIVNACMPMFLAKIGTYQCSSLPGRGQIYAKEAIEKWIRKKYKKARYVTKFDIKSCYPSIRHDVLFSLLERDIKNEDIIYVLKVLVGTYSDDGCGLCIGTYLSQYLANYFLSYAYHYACENLYKIRKGRRNAGDKRVRLVHYVAFYMDDMALFGSSKKDIKKGTHLLIDYIHDKLQLDIKYNQYQLIDLFREGSFVDMVGYRFYKDHTIIRERVYRKICKDMRIIRRQGERTDIKVCKRFMSRHGYVKHSDSTNFRRKTKYDNYCGIARRAVSNEAKRELWQRTAGSAAVPT